VDFDRGLIDLRTGEGNEIKRRAVVPMTDSLRKALTEARKGGLTERVVEVGRQARWLCSARFRVRSGQGRVDRRIPQCAEAYSRGLDGRKRRAEVRAASTSGTARRP
jgi:hypothetical protein